MYKFDSYVSMLLAKEVTHRVFHGWRYYYLVEMAYALHSLGYVGPQNTLCWFKIVSRDGVRTSSRVGICCIEGGLSFDLLYLTLLNPVRTQQLLVIFVSSVRACHSHYDWWFGIERAITSTCSTHRPVWLMFRVLIGCTCTRPRPTIFGTCLSII